MDQLDLFALKSASALPAVGAAAAAALAESAGAAPAEAVTTLEHRHDRAEPLCAAPGDSREFAFEGRAIHLPTMSWEEYDALGDLARQLARPVSVDDLRARRGVCHTDDVVEPEESTIEDAVDDEAESAGELVQSRAPFAGWYPGYPGPATIPVISSPCWELCGHASPPPGCHPGGFYGAEPPTVPCLACKRTMRSCEAELWCCPRPAPCGQVWADAIAVEPGWKLAERYLDDVANDDVGERAAIMMAEGGKPPQIAWRDAFWEKYRANRAQEAL